MGIEVENMKEGSVALPDSFLLANHALNVLESYRRWGGDSESFLATFAGLVAARNKQLAAECIAALENAILEVDEEPASQ
jgi:hypothetical protein